MIFVKILMNADMLSNEKLNAVVAELFIKGGKLNINFFTTDTYFTAPKLIGYTLYTTLY